MRRYVPLFPIAAVLGCSLVGLVAAPLAYATDCPPDVKSCKVLVLTPDEEAALVNPRGVLDTAQAARNLDLANIVAYFRNKIATAPAGNVPPPVINATPDTKPVPVPTPDPRK
jgi:hypothetical protein